MVAPVYSERIMLVMSASYFAWFLLAVNSNFNACSITISLSPLSIILASLPFMLQVSSMDKAHYESEYSSTGELSLAMNSAWAWDLMLPFERTGCRITRPLPTKISFFPPG